MLFEDATTECPYCSETIAVPVDPGGGESQVFHIDCEVCCKPIVIHASWDEDLEEYSISSERES